MALCARLAATTVQVSEEFIEGYVLSPCDLGATLFDGEQFPLRRSVNGKSRDPRGELGVEVGTKGLAHQL